MLNNRDYNIDQNNRDYDFCHNRAALPRVKVCIHLENFIFVSKNVMSVSPGLTEESLGKSNC